MTKHIILSVALLFTFAFGYAQENRAERLKELQNQLDEIQRKSSSGMKDSLKAVQLERDSLKILIEVQELELEATKLDLMRTTNKLKEAEKELEKYRANLELDGYYVVIKSERTEKEAMARFAWLQHKYPNRKLEVIQNSKKTWFYICIAEKYNRGNIGAAVQKVRAEGVKDAWWIKPE